MVAADPAVAFVVTNSGPGVTMALGAVRDGSAYMTAAGAPAEAVAGALATQDALIALVRAGADLETVQAAAGDDGHGPGDDAELELVRRWLDHDPARARTAHVPAARDLRRGRTSVTPVEESITRSSVLRARAGQETPEIATLPGCDHTGCRGG